MQLDNILILGDSFCQDEHAWPNLFVDQVKHPGTNSHVCGTPGAGWWLVRKNFLPFANESSEFIKGQSLLIYIHTNRSRLFNSDKLICQTQPKVINRNDDDLTLAVSMYQKYIADDQFQIWAQNQWFKEFNQLAGQFKTVINLLFEREPHITYSLTGKTIPTTLVDLVNYERDGKLDTLAYDGINGFLNHFSPENNIVFANQLVDIIAGRTDDFDLSKFNKTTLHIN